ncbi:hypothetical protein H4R21_004151 [Coemansia helicoidea]|uniref:Uncharacterized protein n=1 Tax=Coemansia helicoidea TaxID=1286919 RepID=A0ACC1L069_9FUNG|nr:hypothetical protein H4R21_004151 [Coemansia helicoidea]
MSTIASNKFMFADDQRETLRLYSYACSICGQIFETVAAAGDHVKENHFFPPLDM